MSRNINLIKGIFPYGYINKYTKLNEETLAEKKQFYNELTDVYISEDEYKRAKNVWSIFYCKSIEEYSDIYLKSGVLLLAGIFQNFRKSWLSTYKLDPAHYYTFPGLNFDGCLKYTGVALQLLTDLDMLPFFNGTIKGGVSTCICIKSAGLSKITTQRNQIRTFFT